VDIFIGEIDSLCGDRKVVSRLRLAYRGHIYTSSALGDILFLSREIVAYSAPTARSSGVLITNSFEVLILLLLRKGNPVAIEVDNGVIKFQIVRSG